MHLTALICINIITSVVFAIIKIYQLE